MKVKCLPFASFTKKIAKTTVAATAFSMCSMVNLVQAGIINTNHDSFIDDTTNLEWLDFNITSNQSYNEVIANTGNGGSYVGWRLPTTDEVNALYYNAFYDIADSWKEKLDNEVPFIQARAISNQNIEGLLAESSFQQIFAAMGFSLYGDEKNVAQGLYEDSYGDLAYFQLLDYKTTENTDYATLSWGWEDRTDSHRTHGGTNLSTMLVRGASEVPEPSTLAIFALGIVGLAFRGNKQRRFK